MNTSHIKSYAPKARTAFIDAMTKRAALFGIRESSIPAMGITPLEQKGDLALIGDRAFPASIIRPRAALVKKVEQLGFAQAMEQAAYSWFNRLCAIRFMELKGYLDHGLRVLSHPSQPGGFQILDECLNIELPGLDKQRITELKLDGNQDEALYRELLLAQCHALHQAMPFLFEAIDDQTELLLPDNLTKTDSLIRELVDSMPEEDWKDVEIIGWLYQFYISEKKKQVIGKVVKSEDIPAATQLFTPNWIVKYMVQNSLGAQWLATYPDSPLKAQMKYYIEPAGQTDEVNAQLAAITPESLNPEALTLIDPACGSGHILVEGYELFKAIYLERGYRQRDVPQLILEKNLFGLDIDERAAQLTGFALMMKGREDDRRLFEREVKLNVMALVDSADFDPEVVAYGIQLAGFGLQLGDLTELKRLFEHATTFGSLIQVPAGLTNKLPGLKQLSEMISQDLFVADELKSLVTLVKQVEYLAAYYDAVVVNPPYMGRKYHTPALKGFAATQYECGQADLYAMFIERNIAFCAKGRHVAMICMDSWLFGEDFQGTRRSFVEQATFTSMCHLGPHAFPEISGEVVQVAAFVASVGTTNRYECTFVDLVDEKDSAAKEQTLLSNNGRSVVSISALSNVPRGVFTAYRATPSVLDVFAASIPLKDIAEAFTGLQTGDNPRFIRYWFELSFDSIAFGHTNNESAQSSSNKWFPYVKGSDYRKWFGNLSCVVDWGNGGEAIRNHPSARPQNADKYFKSGIAYNNIAKRFSARYVDCGFIFDQKNSMFFAESEANVQLTLGLLHSDAIGPFLRILSPKDFGPGALKIMPVPQSLLHSGDVGDIVTRLIASHRADWDLSEESWDFQSFAMQKLASDHTSTLESSYTAWITQNRETITKMKHLEEENNRLYIDAYGLAEELTPDVPIEQITLTVNPAYRYGGKLTEAELWTRFREDTCAELVSYAIGCMMGRYSLDEPGLIYAHSGNEGFDPSRYASFPADDDGIVPLTDKEWFADDAANRLVEFIALAWDKTHLEANLRFLADNLSPKKGEGSRDTLRRYLCDSFFKDHLQTYKKRPIYWLFSSGKQKAFQCLVYLHRYNESTLSRMRTLHVIPLSAKLNSYANKLEQDIDASTSTAEKKALEKQLSTLHNQQAELATFDEKLRHHADLRITLDLDDGVKVNYGKFGDLLAEVKAVTGDKAD